MSLLLSSILNATSLLSSVFDPQVISGQASISNLSPDTVEIICEDKSILHWSQFDVQQNQTLRFALPTNDSAVLNRVIGNSSSQILGSIQSNGQVILINPNGIIFGKEACIDVNSLVCSTLDAKSFQEFSGSSSGKIINDGLIRASADIFIIADHITNNGSIETTGSVCIAAFEEASLNFSGGTKLYARGTSLDSLFQREVHHAGKIKAKDVCVLGEQIQLFGTIDVSGDYEAGHVYLGGGYQGKSPEFPHAKNLTVSHPASILANTNLAGDGGKVVLWSDERTIFTGSILAQGGSLNGHGGFVEISGAFLEFNGDVSTFSQNGRVGTLLLDPVDVTISSAPNSNIPVGNLPAPPPVVANPYTVPFSGSPANIFNMALQNALGVNDVIIDSTAGGAGTGNITVNDPVVWASGTRLTLNSANNITITNGANIQESGAGNTGGVILIAPTGGTILIQGTQLVPTSVGSQNGITSIGDPNVAICNRSRPNVNLTSSPGGTEDFGVRLGFTGANALGPIEVVCNNLTMTANLTSVGIGHGISAMVLNINAPITVSASGNLLQQVLLGVTQCYSIIGHGAYSVIGTGTNLNGDISVTAGGNITFANNVGGNGTNIRIGHGTTRNFVTPSAITSLRGNITVSSGGNLTLSSTTNNLSSIGHYQSLLFRPNLIVGNIYVTVANDIYLTGSGDSGSIIGHYTNANFGAGAPLGIVNASINVTAGRDIFLGSALGQLGAGRNFIGVITNIPASLVGNVSVFAGRDITMQNRSPNANPQYDSRIGNLVTAGGDGNSNTYVGVGRNLNILNPLTLLSRIVAPGDVNVGVSGNLNVTANNPAQVCFITTTNTIPVSTAGGSTTRVWVGGNISTTANFRIGSQFGVLAASIDIRAGGSITYPNNFATGPGTFFMAAPTQFQNGQLWTTENNPSRLATASLQGSAFPVVLNSCFGSLITPVQSPLNTPAAATTFPFVSITTTTGAITLSSPLTFTNGSPQISSDSRVALTPCNQCSQPSADLILGPGSTQIATNSGNITIGTFQNITVSQAVSTTGNIDITACRTLDVNNNISSTGGGFVHLSGTNVLSSAIISTITGPICLNATQSISLLSDVISASGGSISVVGEDVSLSSQIDTSGPIVVISQNTSLLGTASINSSGSAVTIIVDRSNPSNPISPPFGVFTMDPGTSITSGVDFPLNIFTSQQNLNTISGTLNSNLFVPGTLFEDTVNEIWCTFPPSFISCGNCQFQAGCLADCPSFLFLSTGIPYTIFYKNCLQLVMQQAAVIVDQFLVSLHPYNEYPGWVERFSLQYADSLQMNQPIDYCFIRRRLLNSINNPKYWTVIQPE
jgi:filamentous hemagglutinin family protein